MVGTRKMGTGLATAMVASSSVGRRVGNWRLERKPKEWEGQKRRKERKREGEKQKGQGQGSAGGPTGRNPAPGAKGARGKPRL